ncbi:unnamed protein product [Adineta ricciae]|uniref:Transmembrane protein n=1 Tax=Adineta ricciae TaxID=249248 RepID=A0A814PIQ6_ADIRI|nr:unnamed protein product [Adineta ricciae]
MLIESFVVHGVHRPTSSCDTPKCQHEGAVVTSAIVGLITSIILFILLCKLFGDFCGCVNISFDDEKFLMDNCGGQTTSNVNLFQSGVWSSQYYRSEDCHGPFQFPLIFSSSNNKIKGYGSDDIGTFNVNGIYSDNTNRIVLIKKYQTIRNKSQEISKYEARAQLIWNNMTNQFEGTWKVKTAKNTDKGKFILQFLPGSFALKIGNNNQFNISSIYLQLFKNYITYEVYSDLISMINRETRILILYQYIIISVAALTMIIVCTLIPVNVFLLIYYDNYGIGVLLSILTFIVVPLCLLGPVSIPISTSTKKIHGKVKLYVEQFSNQQINSQTIDHRLEWNIEFYNDCEPILYGKPYLSDQQKIANPMERTIIPVS